MLEREVICVMLKKLSLRDFQRIENRSNPAFNINFCANVINIYINLYVVDLIGWITSPPNPLVGEVMTITYEFYYYFIFKILVLSGNSL